MATTLVLGTHNRKKRLELEAMLATAGIGVESLADVRGAIQVEEDGETFAENARKKAVEQARHLHRWVLAEDSGLAVDALAGRPGVYSARYAGPDASDEANNRRLLEELGQTPLEKRSAHYTCHVVLADPDGSVHSESCGSCRGRIRFQQAGSQGFGYDPLFEVVEYHRTFGELGPHVKRALSHRGRAMRAIVPRIVALLQ